MATILERASKYIVSAITYYYFHFQDDHRTGISNNMPRGRPLSLQTVELKVMMCCSGCERVVKNAIHKLRGVASVEVNLEMEKVTVGGYVDRNKVLKAVRRAGKRAEFWPYPDIPLYFTSAHHYFKDTTNEFKESYNYYKHGYFTSVNLPMELSNSSINRQFFSLNFPMKLTTDNIPSVNLPTEISIGKSANNQFSNTSFRRHFRFFT